MNQDFSKVLHPWHGVTYGKSAPIEVEVFIEITPNDTIKYEVDKPSGLLRVDRPQKYSNQCPLPYGFIPQTYCGEKIAQLCMSEENMSQIEGDKDPMDICILTSYVINHGNILLSAIPIGGLRMIDKNEADDKIIAVLKDDPVYGKMQDIEDCPEEVISKLRHYFLTYKLSPNSMTSPVEIPTTYNKAMAHKAIMSSIEDYRDKFLA